ncbi:MAG: tetratricopeptide repeat protein [Bacteroidales bacterium]|nr:tetratricopeptide repeat protein [Bacteroidales bacterium]
MKRLIIILALCVGVAVQAAALAIVERADSAYNKEDYPSAIALYNQAIDEGYVSAGIYYNLGNAYYRDGRPGRAVIAYERSLRIDPGNADTRANLDFVRSRLEDLPEDDNSFLTNVHHDVVTAQSANGWAWTALAVFVLMCGAVALYIFSGNVMLRKTGFFGAIVLAVLTVYFIVVAADAYARLSDDSEAVVIVPTTLLNSVPRQPRQTEKVVPLHEGTKVEIIDSVSTPDDPVSPRWYNVKINNSTGAWLRATDVERI